MELQPIHKRMLVAYQSYRRSGFSFRAFFRGAGKRLIALLVVVSICAFLLLNIGISWAAALIVGMAVGAILRDIAYFRQAKQAWPLLVTIIDWQRVEALQHATTQQGTHADEG